LERNEFVFHIPDGVEVLDYRAFALCADNVTIVVPASVIFIDLLAFMIHSNQTHIIFEGDTELRIGAFGTAAEAEDSGFDVFRSMPSALYPKAGRITVSCPPDSKISAYCKEYGIKVGIENMFQRELLRGQISFDTCNQIPEFIRYVDTLDSEYMVACLDIGHVGLPTRDDEAWDFIRALGHDRLQALHVHDNDYRVDKHALPYLGKIDWNEVTKALGEIDYQGDFTYEVNLTTFMSKFMNEEMIPTAMRYAHDVGRHLCTLVDKNRP
jgi:hypothetical protein